MSGEEYNHETAHYAIFSSPLLAFSSLRSIIFLRPLFSKTLSLCASLDLGDQFHTPIKLEAKLEISKF